MRMFSGFGKVIRHPSSGSIFADKSFTCVCCPSWAKSLGTPQVVRGLPISRVSWAKSLRTPQVIQCRPNGSYYQVNEK